jgi:Raf kinase inhibitor-like YbhB/YbcL family protein
LSTLFLPQHSRSESRRFLLRVSKGCQILAHVDGGPCPPSGTHRYVFQLFALDIMLALPEGMRKEEVLAKMKGHVIVKAELVGT